MGNIEVVFNSPQTQAIEEWKVDIKKKWCEIV